MMLIKVFHRIIILIYKNLRSDISFSSPFLILLLFFHFLLDCHTLFLNNPNLFNSLLSLETNKKV